MMHYSNRNPRVALLSLCAAALMSPKSPEDFADEWMIMNGHGTKMTDVREAARRRKSGKKTASTRKGKPGKKGAGVSR